MHPERDERTSETGEITRLLALSAGGSDVARDRLAALVYAELHRMASVQMRGERADHTLGATGLVSETYLRLFRVDGGSEQRIPWCDRRAFFGAAATAMRRVLIDHARARLAEKRGGRVHARFSHLEPDAVAASKSLEPVDFLALAEAITRLEEVDERAAEITNLRFFAGQDIATVALLTGISERTTKRAWNFARAWLHDYLERDGGA